VPNSYKSAGESRILPAGSDDRSNLAGQPPALQGALIDSALQFLISRGQQRSGQDFLDALVTFLGQSLGVAYAFCGKIVGDVASTVETVALYGHGSIMPNMSYELVGTPCDHVVGKAMCFHDSGIQTLFPKDHLLVQMGAESYAGIPLFFADGKPLGILVVIDTKQMDNPVAVRGLLQILGASAASELERSTYESQLRASEARFRDVAEVTSDWFWETDADMRFSYFSERTQERGGFDPSDYIGRSRTDIAAELLTEPKWERHFDDLRHHRPFRDFEYEFRTTTGEILVANISGQPMFDDSGNFRGYRGAGSNVTERRRTQQALEASERRFQDFAAVSSDWFWETDAEHRFTYFSPRNRDITGFDPSQYIGRTRMQINPIGVKPEVIEAHLDDLRNRRPFRDFRYGLEGKMGNRLTISVSGKPVFDTAGQFVGYRGTGTDITREVEIEKERDDERQLLQIILDNLPFPVTLNDVDGCYLFANKVFEDWYGVAPGTVIGRTATDVLALDADELQRRAEMEDAAMRTQTMQSREIAKVLADGELHHLVVIKFPVRDREGQVSGFATISTDITARKSQEIALQDMNRRLIAANRAKSEFLAHMSHELRTPLNSVLGFSQIIRDATFGPEFIDRYREYAGDIYDSARHLLDLITDILDIAKIEAGETSVDAHPVDLSEIIASCLRLVAQQLNSKLHRPVIEIADPDLRLNADSRLVCQILVNIVTNASKFTKHGGTIAISVDRAPDGGMRIRVADNGIGMDEGDIVRAMEPFGQVRHSPDVAHGGTGLGLPLAKKFVELHGGTLSLTSKLGKGTIVTIAFPPERTIETA
jgi:PAS domain S-box-containing protein